MTTITAAKVEALPAGSYSIDPVHSSIGFEIAYLGGTFRGSFSGVEAALIDGELTGSAKVEKVHVQDENLSAHLLGPDFFDAERFPELSFASTAARLDGERLEVEGTLTIKGVTKPVELTGTIAEPIVDPYGNERVGIELATTVDRTGFGLNWNVPLPSGEPALSNDVRIAAQLFLVKGQ